MRCTVRRPCFGTASILLEERCGADGKGALTVPATAVLRRGESTDEVYQVADASGDLMTGVVRRAEIEVRRGLTGNELIKEPW